MAAKTFLKSLNTIDIVIKKYTLILLTGGGLLTHD